MDQLIVQIYAAIGENDLLAAVGMMEQAPELNRSVRSELVSIRRRIHEADELLRKALVTQDQFGVLRNQITSSLLKIVELHHWPLEKELSAQVAKQVQVLEEILFQLKLTHRAYIAQCRMRNILMDRLKARFEIESVENYYQVFTRFYNQMDETDLQYHKTIRGYTQNIMKPGHYQVLDLLLENRELVEVFPPLEVLQEHLLFWKSKYESIFEQDESQTLIYLGVEEGVKFPTGIEHEIRKFLAKYD